MTTSSPHRAAKDEDRDLGVAGELMNKKDTTGRRLLCSKDGLKLLDVGFSAMSIQPDWK